MLVKVEIIKILLLNKVQIIEILLLVVLVKVKIKMIEQNNQRGMNLIYL